METESRPNRAGYYERQPSGYKAFIPVPLPPADLRLSDEIVSFLSRADRALGRLDGSVTTMPDPDYFVFLYVRNEAVLSSQIEGTQSSLMDLLSAEAEIIDVHTPRDVNEVINYVRAMNHGIRRLAELPVSVRLVREIHAELLQGIRGSHIQPGELRTSQNWIGPAGTPLSSAAFVPPPQDRVPDFLSDWEKFLHERDAIPPLIKIALAHAQFETIHPFLDGNGRVGRLLISFLLTEKGALSKPVLYLSLYFKRHRVQYYERLQAIRDEGDWESWLIFFLQGVIDIADEAVKTVRKILDLRERHRDLLTTRLGPSAANGLKVLETLFGRPIISVAQVENLIGTSYATANKLVSRMVEGGILAEVTGYQRNRRFAYEAYLSLFNYE